MSCIPKMQRGYLLISASEKWRETVAAALNVPVKSVLWVDNVYEGLALAVRQSTENRPTWVGVVIDSLNREQMRIFPILKKLDNVEPTAICLDGSRAVISRISECVSGEIVLMEQFRLNSSSAECKQGEMPQRPERQQVTDMEPFLSREEIETLLGNSELTEAE